MLATYTTVTSWLAFATSNRQDCEACDRERKPNTLYFRQLYTDRTEKEERYAAVRSKVPMQGGETYLPHLRELSKVSFFINSLTRLAW
jgi:hypothetical protein